MTSATVQFKKLFEPNGSQTIFSQFYNGYSGKPALVQLLAESIDAGTGHTVV
jgi:hypothetical protein